ncbi:transcription factor SPT20 homolog isoform X2 [Leptopilina heterotoma]|uniref:transcription factor SPT20 homolog isoform X2 n=1 Tax=Leptopilina heterotoma TaxID=63436 RepID=UPI001CA8FAEC|nr:transcription factor SPT20 homolog isoform X2 [Leptopilina heterotoma]
MTQKNMKISKKFIFFLCVHLTSAQLNFEGNPLTENTDYLAEESQISARSARGNNFEKSINNEVNQLTLKEQSVTPQKLYPVYTEAQNISQQKPMETSVQNREESIQVLKLVPMSQKSRQLRDNFLNVNSVQQEQTPGQNPADLALEIFMNSKTPQESEIALNYYLQGGQGLSEQLENEKREKERQQEQEYLRQQQIQQEQIIQRQKQQQLQQEQLLIQEQLQRTQVQQNVQDQMFGLNVQPQQLNQIQPNYQNQYQIGYHRIPLIQSRNDYPIYRRPMKRMNYRPAFQSRVGPGMYKGPPPPLPPMQAPVYPGKMIKPPVEVLYSRPPTYARGAPMINSPAVYYEDASPWFPEVEHKPPPSKDIYYSQLYAQSYDPHYYNYIAKTGKIKPHLYGKLNGEAKQDDGILAELFRGFTKHGMKNIMNPTFLLGMTIPALTFMLTALVQKRSLARSDSRSLNEDEIREYLERLERALECYRNLKVPTDDRCWR